MASTSVDEEDVPPLEDLTDVLEKVKSSQYTDSGTNKTTIRQKKTQQPVTRTKNRTQEFGGFQKGFLMTKQVKSKAKHINKQDDIPVIHPKKESNSSLTLPEVQRAMEPSFLQNKDWVTDDLLKNLEKRPDLLKKLADPRYSQALSMFRSNPEQGLKLIEGNKELQDFIKEFCGILGEHFALMADQKDKSEDNCKGIKSQSTKEDEEQMKKILSDPETLEILKDPWVSKLVKNLKENPSEARRILATSRPDVLPKIKKLIDAGILSYG